MRSTIGGSDVAILVGFLRWHGNFDGHCPCAILHLHDILSLLINFMGEGSMAIVLQVQVSNAVHTMPMPDRETADKYLEALSAVVGKPRFSRNDDEPKNMRVTGAGCSAVFALDDIHSVLVHDQDIELDVQESALMKHDRMRAAIYRDIDHEFFERAATISHKSS